MRSHSSINKHVFCPSFAVDTIAACWNAKTTVQKRPYRWHAELLKKYTLKTALFSMKFQWNYDSLWITISARRMTFEDGISRCCCAVEKIQITAQRHHTAPWRVPISSSDSALRLLSGLELSIFPNRTSAKESFHPTTTHNWRLRAFACKLVITRHLRRDYGFSLIVCVWESISREHGNEFVEIGAKFAHSMVECLARK